MIKQKHVFVYRSFVVVLS